MSEGSDFNSILNSEENILWAGTPSLGYLILNGLPRAFWGIFVMGLMTVMSQPHWERADWRLWLAESPFYIVGFGLMLTPLGYYVKGTHTKYLITDQRIIIVSKLINKKVEIIAPADICPVELEIHDGVRGTVTISKQLLVGSDSNTVIKVKLVGIRDYQQVMQLIEKTFKKSNSNL